MRISLAAAAQKVPPRQGSACWRLARSPLVGAVPAAAIVGTTGLGGRADVREQAVEPPGDARRIGARRLHRVADCREPALQPRSRVTGQRPGGETAPRWTQPARAAL